MQNKRLEARLAVVNRHNDLKLLEQRCGIEKIRDKSLPEGAFGYIKRHKASRRIEELSKPRTAAKGSRYDHQDFRGLLHADFSEAVSRISGAMTKNTSSNAKSMNKTVEKKGEMELSEIEFGLNQKEISRESSIEVTGYDMVQEFFQLD